MIYTCIIELYKVNEASKAWGKPVLPAVLLQPNKGKAQFWSPTKLKDEERFTNAKKTAQEEEKLRKAEEKRNKQRKKEDLAIIVAQRKSNKERDRRAKKQATEEVKTQKEVDKQLKINPTLATPNPKSRSKPSKPPKQVVVVVEDNNIYEEQG
ncbi:hypothetical protein EJ08DRAFT_675570 [Tothia fuscella]|uniref:Uncharacterized protein n=1 Tax=Tothia fuscella TaxID=1048955 RepID=A0A9P4P0R0_9PEZI|nr:hypothetical protein EJ08DRAFT_675570 [Tothia fuscella]